MTKRVWASVLAVAFAIACLETAFAAPVATTVVVTVVPNAPSSLTAVPTSPSQVVLTWTNNASIADYVSIERKLGVAGTYAEIATTTPTIATYVDNSVTPVTTYFYRVRAFADVDFSDYSNEASVTTQSTASGGGSGGTSGGSGGGGGGGGGYFAPPAPITNVTMSGSAYPSSKVFILKDGQVALQTIAGPDANFTASLTGLSGGNYTFSVYGQDSTGLRSSLFTFPVMITPGATTLISGIFLSPTIDVDKQEVKQGDTLTIFGESVPDQQVRIQVNSAQTLLLQATSTGTGAYIYDLDTAVLAMGSHSTKSKAIAGSLISQDSVLRAFTVGTENVAAQPVLACPPKGDLNGDCRVNLIDFSILAYWYKRPGFPKAYDLNGDGVLNLTDFSIMAYYWTG
jgi:hypothetical protein